jgi:DNA repair protein RecO (recombination protein O)
MNQIVTTAMTLARTDYGEANRIVTMLTPDKGKLRLMAKGVRRNKSRLAGGIELFSISQITYIPGRGEIGTLISARLITHFGTIVRNIDRTMFGYEVLKTLHKVTEDMADDEYFDLLKQTITGLDKVELPLDALRLWFNMQQVRLAGHSPNLRTDAEGAKLQAGETYSFSTDDMTFVQGGQYGTDHIKLLRLAIGLESPLALAQITGIDTVMIDCLRLSELMLL